MTLTKAPEPQGYVLFGPQPRFPDVPYAEWKARINKARKLMRENKIDLLMLWSMQNCRYFAGFTSIHWHLPSIQPLVTLIPIEGEPVAITGDFFRWTVEGQSWIRDIRTQSDVHQVKSEREFPGEVAATVKEMGYGKGNIALEKGSLGHTWIPRPLNDIQTLMKDLPEARFVDGDKVIWGCRMVKSPLEIDRLMKAAAIHRQSMAAVAEQYRPGMTERDVGKIFLLKAYENDAEWVVPGHIMCGPEKEGMYDTGYHFDGVIINKGDCLSIDMIMNYKGYWADMGRMINVGPPTDSFKKCWENVCRGFDAAVQAAKPGVRAMDVWRAVNTVIEDAEMMGFEMYGHGIGIDVQEPPVVAGTDETVLEAGMTFEIESLSAMGLRRMGGEGGFQFENLLIITETGATPVMGLPREIIQTACC
ncbi:aminopeptidase P family protein [Candidatus Poribacteria bacterium]|nr:aminopeptidase P family protein [Candidatus Poribacteria bacterium]